MEKKKEEEEDFFPPRPLYLWPVVKLRTGNNVLLLLLSPEVSVKQYNIPLAGAGVSLADKNGSEFLYAGRARRV